MIAGCIFYILPLNHNDSKDGKRKKLFITFEGIEGCGKTTQTKRLSKKLQDQGIRHLITREPGGSAIGASIRQILLDSRNIDLVPLAELFLYAADRAQHIDETIRPALDQGDWVICDRFIDATVAYQGTARGQDIAFIKLLNKKAINGILPEITFLCDCPVETGLARAMKRNKELAQEDQDRFEQEALDFHKKVRQGYLNLAKEYSTRFVIIDATLSEDEMEQQVFETLEPLLP